jgi:hypothetical protein
MGCFVMHIYFHRRNIYEIKFPNYSFKSGLKSRSVSFIKCYEVAAIAAVVLVSGVVVVVVVVVVAAVTAASGGVVVTVVVVAAVAVASVV